MKAQPTNSILWDARNTTDKAIALVDLLSFAGSGMQAGAVSQGAAMVGEVLSELKRQLAQAQQALEPVAAVNPPEPPANCLSLIYYTWQKAKADYNSLGLHEDHPDMVARLDLIAACENLAESCVPDNIKDFAFKVIFADDNGDMNMNPAQEALVRLSYRLVGIETAQKEARA